MTMTIMYLIFVRVTRTWSHTSANISQLSQASHIDQPAAPWKARGGQADNTAMKQETWLDNGTTDDYPHLYDPTDLLSANLSGITPSVKEGPVENPGEWVLCF